MQNHHLRGITETEDTVELFLTSGEKRGLLYGSCAYVTDEPVVIDIRTEKGNIRLERDILEIQTAEGKERFVFPEDPKLGKSYWGAGHKRCINDFYRSLTDGKPYRNDVASCVNTMSVLLAAYDQIVYKGIVCTICIKRSRIYMEVRLFCSYNEPVNKFMSNTACNLPFST